VTIKKATGQPLTRFKYPLYLDTVMHEHVNPELLKGHWGEWVIVCNNKVIAHHKDIRAIKDQINSCKGTPIITRVPKGAVWIF